MILAYTLIVLLSAAIVYLWLEVKKLKATKLGIKQEANGEVILTYNKQEIYNYKLENR